MNIKILSINILILIDFCKNTRKLDESYNLVIIGGGLAGLTAAFESYHKSNYSLNQKDYEVNSLSKGAKTIETESDKNSKYRNKTENKRIQIDTSKYKNSSSTNKYQIKTKSISSEKERNLAIKKIGEEDKEKIENHNKTNEYNNMKLKINKYEIDTKKNNDLIKKYKNENMCHRDEIKKLKKDKEILEIQNAQLIEKNEKMKDKINKMNKKINELESKIKKGEKIFCTEFDKSDSKNNKRNQDDKDDKDNKDDKNDENENYGFE